MEAQLHHKIDSLTIVNNISEAPFLIETSMEAAPPCSFPNLRHLTVSPSYHELSGLRIECPRLTSLHLCLDGRGFEFDLERPKLDAFTRSDPLTSYTISGRGTYVSLGTLFRAIELATRHIACLPRLKIKDMVILEDSLQNGESLLGQGRFQELSFDQVLYGSTHGPDTFEMKSLDRDFVAFPLMCERADRVREMKGSFHRVLEECDWRSHR